MARSRYERVVIGLIIALSSAAILAAVGFAWKSVLDLLEGAVPIPRGGVVAFDRPGGCPAGWSDFATGQGRTIVGAGKGYEYRSTGGLEGVALTVEQLPPHKHNVIGVTLSGRVVAEWGFDVAGNGHSLRFAASDGPPWSGVVGTLVTDPKGHGNAHENRPPYVALHLCSKN